MKEKAKLEEIVSALQSEDLMKRDYVVPSKCLNMENGKLVFDVNTENGLLNQLLRESGVHGLSDVDGRVWFDGIGVFHRQLAERLEVPAVYYQRMMEKDNLKLLDQSVNHWLGRSDKTFFVRTFVNEEEKRGMVRAILSDRFKAIDNWDVLMTVLKVIKESADGGDDMTGQVKFESGDITDTKMILRFSAPHISTQAPELLKNYRVPGGRNLGDSGICSGFVITNSEVGGGAFTIAPRIIISACSNGMVYKSEQMWKSHVGERLEKFSWVKWSEQTVRKNQELILAQVTDTLKTYLSPEWLGNFVSRLDESAKLMIQKPIETMELVSKECSFSKDESEKILSFFIGSGDNSLFGIAQAMTFFAQECQPERRFEFEEAATNLCVSETLVPVIREMQLS